MTGEISSDYGAVTDGTGRALGDLPLGSGGRSAVPGVDPRLTMAVDDTGAQNRRGRDKVHDAGERTGRYTKASACAGEFIGVLGAPARGGFSSRWRIAHKSSPTNAEMLENLPIPTKA